jgi:hypothetical protein
MKNVLIIRLYLKFNNLKNQNLDIGLPDHQRQIIICFYCLEIILHYEYLHDVICALNPKYEQNSALDIDISCYC